MKYKTLVLIVPLLCGSLVQAETLVKGSMPEDVKIEIEKENWKFWDKGKNVEIELTGVGEPICKKGWERVKEEVSGYVLKVKNPNGGWCYFFPREKEMKSKK